MSGRRKALIVATGEYDHAGLRRLLAPAADAARLAEVLGDPRIGDFDVQVVRDRAAHEVQAQVEDLFATGRPDDVLLAHFSCHGLKSESGELFFAARNTRPDRLGSTAVPADFVQRCLRSSRSRSIVLLLDCCYGGAFGHGVTVRAAGDVNVLDSFPGGTLGGGRARAVITASSAMEYAFEGDQLTDDQTGQPSVFTSALVKGLATGEADRDEDGWVSLNELYDYVFDRVRAENPHQTPSRDLEMSGELYLARSRRRRIRPAPVPPDLKAAMTDSNMFTRLGAVAELRPRLTSDDLPVAAGAYEALADIARTDITQVADAAAAGLEDVAVRVEEPELHFGQVTQGSEPPRRSIELQGPPLARTCTFEASHGWLTVEEETPGGLAVSVDTSDAGRLQGHVTVTGLTGEVTVTVDIEITPEPAEQPAPSPESDASPEPAPTDAAQLTLAGTPEIVAEAKPATPTGATPTEARVERWLKLAGALAIGSAALLLMGLLLPYRDDASFLEQSDWVFTPVAFVIIVAVLTAGAAVLVLVPRTRTTVGPGLLLGLTAAATWLPAELVTEWLAEGQRTTYQAGLWLELVAGLTLVGAGVLAGRAVIRARDTRVLHQRPHGALAWTVAVLGLAGAISLVVIVGALLDVLVDHDHWFAIPVAWMVVPALVVPACAATAVPRRFGIFLLAGWVGGAAALVINYHVFSAQMSEQYGTDVNASVNVFGVTLLGLFITAALLARPLQGESTHK